MKTGGIGASLSAVINESLFDDLDHQVRFFELPQSPPGFKSQQSKTITW
jgi:pyruvate/2-oxoglutarate/acetoin dehydrogenase E1 component